jgi:hypothetical protein
MKNKFVRVKVGHYFCGDNHYTSAGIVVIITKIISNGERLSLEMKGNVFQLLLR